MEREYLLLNRPAAYLKGPLDSLFPANGKVRTCVFGHPSIAFIYFHFDSILPEVRALFQHVQARKSTRAKDGRCVVKVFKWRVMALVITGLVYESISADGCVLILHLQRAKRFYRFPIVTISEVATTTATTC